MSKKVIVIGSGFSSLAAASSLAQKGNNVTILEKNNQCGGRARQFKSDGFTFDMGPSWYWMPDVFENYFKRFGKKPEDYYKLLRLDPSYRVFWGEKDFTDLPANQNELYSLFEAKEKNGAKKLDAFLKEAAYKYEVGINDLVYKPGRSLFEFADWRVISGIFRLQLFQSLSKHVRKYFKNDRLIRLLEFPVLFLGAKPNDTPALYSLMNYADMKLGTWYPHEGMHKIIDGMVAVAKDQGVKIILNQEVKKINTQGNKAVSVSTNTDTFIADAIVSGADYNHTDKQLLSKEHQNYSKNYWQKRKMAPSSLIFYLGINKKLQNLQHHNLFFDEDFTLHAEEIYDYPKWPSKPLFYVCAPSITDNTVAPKGKENLFILMPAAPDLEDKDEVRDRYYELIMDRLEKLTEQEIKPHVIYKRAYAHNDFIADYHAFKGNAYGLANTLKQTAILKPSLRNKKLKNVFYTGQLTTPGPGVPPSLISGQVVANELEKSIPS